MNNQSTNQQGVSMNNDANNTNEEILKELKKQNEKLEYLSDGLVDHSAMAAGKIIVDSMVAVERRFPSLINLLVYISFSIIAILLYMIFIDNSLFDAYIQ